MYLYIGVIMLKRLSELRIVSWRDIILFAVVIVAVFVATVVWSLPGSGADIIGQVVNRYLLTVLYLGAAAIVAIIPLFLPGWPRGGHRIATAMVRFGIALEIIAVLTSVIGLYFATDPTRSVPIGFAAFTAMLIGLFVAGFGGNQLAPPRA
jgi:hypothetical protein